MTTTSRVILAIVILAFLLVATAILGAVGAGGATLMVGISVLARLAGAYLILLAAYRVWKLSQSDSDYSAITLAPPIVLALIGALLQASNWGIGLALGLIGAMALHSSSRQGT
jgi:hypothetical protein